MTPRTWPASTGHLQCYYYFCLYSEVIISPVYDVYSQILNWSLTILLLVLCGCIRKWLFFLKFILSTRIINSNAKLRILNCKLWCEFKHDPPLRDNPDSDIVAQSSTVSVRDVREHLHLLSHGAFSHLGEGGSRVTPASQWPRAFYSWRGVTCRLGSNNKKYHSIEFRFKRCSGKANCEFKI